MAVKDDCQVTEDGVGSHTIAGAIISQFQPTSTYTDYNILDDPQRHPLIGEGGTADGAK